MSSTLFEEEILVSVNLGLLLIFLSIRSDFTHCLCCKDLGNTST